MSNQPLPPLGQTSSAAERAAQLRNHESRFLKALKLLIETGKAKSTDDLIRYASQDNQSESVNYLRSVAGENLPVDLAFDALSVNLRLIAHKRNSSVLQECLSRQVGLIMPLPPHVVEAFVSLMPVTLVVPDGHHVPHWAGETKATVVSGSRAGRAALANATAIVFEVYCDDGPAMVDAEVADLLEGRLNDQGLMLITHLRPHQNPDDIVLPTSRERIQPI
jgi:hypothetical protein